MIGDLDVRMQDGVMVVQGAVDYANVQTFVDLAEAAFAPGTTVVLDLAGVEFMDSAGRGALVQLRQRAGGSKESLVIRHLHPHVARLLEITALLSFFTLGAPAVTGRRTRGVPT
jgi:anti-anti-sigma factor